MSPASRARLILAACGLLGGLAAEEAGDRTPALSVAGRDGSGVPPGEGADRHRPGLGPAGVVADLLERRGGADLDVAPPRGVLGQGRAPARLRFRRAAPFLAPLAVSFSLWRHPSAVVGILG